MLLQIKIRGKDSDYMRFPLQYNYSLQGLVYKMLEPHLANFLHENGYAFEKRRFKMFSFSRILGEFQIDKEKKEIIFMRDANFCITSPVDELIRQVSNSLLLEPSLRIGKQAVIVEEVKVGHQSINSANVIVRSLSPITIYSTLYKGDGSKFTYYFHPREKDFSRLIKENLIKKYNAFYGKSLDDFDFSIKSTSKVKQHVINYKNTIIKGYSGTFILEGDMDLIKFALEAGIGGKTSQGFGCLQILKEYNQGTSFNISSI